MTCVLTNVDPALRSCWHPVLRLADLGDEPVEVTLLGEDWVVARLGGEVTILADRTVARPAAVAEHLGLVWVAPEEPRTALPEPPIAEDERPRFLSGELPVVRARASAGLLVDNFLDVAHFPFVHAATIGNSDEGEASPFEVERDGLSLRIRSAQVFPNREDPEVLAGRRPLLQTRHALYRYTAPFSGWLRMDYEEAGGTNVITFFIQPVDAETCHIYASVARDDLDGDVARLEEALAFERSVTLEDLVVQEAYVERSIPLDLTTEVHIKADKMTVELRRVLADLVAGG